jgi:type VI secretion system protein ImpH
MAAPGYGWQREQSVADWLQHQPFRFEFLQAVRIIEAIQRRLRTTGVSEGPVEIRFRSRVSFEFPASEVQSIDSPAFIGPREENFFTWPTHPEITVNFLGLAGVLGPLPEPYAEMVQTAIGRKNRAASDFLDLFNHRLVALLYRAHKAQNPPLTGQSPDRGQIAQYLFSLIGLGPTALRGRVGVPDRALLHYSGLLARDVRSAIGLERLLSDYFDANVHVFQFVGMWRALDPAQFTRIGAVGKNSRMGDGAVLGRRVWDQGGGVTIQIGPLGFERFQSMLPGGRANDAIAHLARFYLGIRHRINIRLLLNPAEVPPMKLGSARLGYTSWIIAGGFRDSTAAAGYRVPD